jgi:hypothetical protein
MYVPDGGGRLVYGFVVRAQGPKLRLGIAGDMFGDRVGAIPHRPGVVTRARQTSRAVNLRPPVPSTISADADALLHVHVELRRDCLRWKARRGRSRSLAEWCANRPPASDVFH